ncbi:MAG: hypothetical protein LJI21_02285 [Wolbachia endosymbiont of Menacanthus eurysternus]|nr:MAG: hypothetical protein LJI21_02285 [Wolbachia endosymbiont of Menacanthus eurysternus]
MLNIARKYFIKSKPVYNELINMEMTDFLKQKRNHLYDITFTEVLHHLCNFRIELELAKSINIKETIIRLLRKNKNDGNNKFINKEYFCHSESYIQQIAKNKYANNLYMSYCKIYESQINGILYELHL